MSYATWEKQFYPVPADKTSKADALAHSIKKWRGLSAVNLKKHGVSRGHMIPIIYGAADSDSGSLDIDSSSCALCRHFYRTRAPNPCAKCPGAIANDISCTAAYLAFTNAGNPAPMLKWLRKALK